MTTPNPVDLLILGAGWTSTFLLPLLSSLNITHASTTRSGRDNTLPFTFDPLSSDAAPFARLPAAKTVLITFPITVPGASRTLVELYTSTHHGGGAGDAAFVQLGSSGVWAGAEGTVDRHAAVDRSARALAEKEMMALGGSVLNLAGLWGGARDPRGWVSRVAKSAEQLAGKGSLHVIHGEDVAAAVVAVHKAFEKAKGQRWLLTDLRSYDWWDLALAWGEVERDWVLGLLEAEGEKGVLPRERTKRGRALDSSEFWRTFGILPKKSLYDIADGGAHE
ncbi:hypothetical protein FN846DRAFT_775185 [Sphaerosporella brunnea]|uniref:NAD(P)-binding domain-containing protein n=1 Tax=Sphaerosporella brunnea TaxID=1250544 RepID=A0A5J5F2Q2_9PEZI|nr:hypothetical protein FN846DRAFT_775185 [Sphaerosporella brunnea]